MSIQKMYNPLDGLWREYFFLYHFIGYIYLSDLKYQKCNLRIDWQRIPLRRYLVWLSLLEDLRLVFMGTTLLQKQEVVK